MAFGKILIQYIVMKVCKNQVQIFHFGYLHSYLFVSNITRHLKQTKYVISFKITRNKILLFMHFKSIIPQGIDVKK